MYAGLQYIYIYILAIINVVYYMVGCICVRECHAIGIRLSNRRETMRSIAVSTFAVTRELSMTVSYNLTALAKYVHIEKNR